VARDNAMAVPYKFSYTDIDRLEVLIDVKIVTSMGLLPKVGVISLGPVLLRDFLGLSTEDREVLRKRFLSRGWYSLEVVRDMESPDELALLLQAVHFKWSNDA
jgi:hypothetical protein